MGRVAGRSKERIARDRNWRVRDCIGKYAFEQGHIAAKNIGLEYGTDFQVIDATPYPTSPLPKFAEPVEVIATVGKLAKTDWLMPIRKD